MSASNIGLAPYGLTCSALPVYTGSASPPAGTVIARQRITKPLSLIAGNITIDESCIQPTVASQGLPILSTYDLTTWVSTTGTVTIRDSEMDGSLLSQFAAAWSPAFIGVANLQNNYIHGFGSGIALMATGSQLSSTIEGNYVTGLIGWGDAATTGNHSDAFTVRDFDANSNPARQLIVRNNRFNCDSPNATGAFFIQTYSGDIDNLTVQGNLLEGNGYQLGLEGNHGNTYSNVKSINNRFTGTGWGATYRTGGPGWAQWTDNYINAPTKTDNKGTTVNQP